MDTTFYVFAIEVALAGAGCLLALAVWELGRWVVRKASQ